MTPRKTAFSEVGSSSKSKAMPAPCRSNYYKYVAMLAPELDRSDLKARLREQHGVALSGEVYALPLHCQPVFE